MKLAFAEMRRSSGRFAAIAGAVGFIVFLALILSALGDGLYLGQTGVFRVSEADAYVFSDDSGNQIARSSLDPAVEADIARLDGVDATGTLGTSVLPSTLGDDTEIQLSLIGATGTARPASLTEGRWPIDGADEVVADSQLLRRGLAIGDPIRVNGGPELTVVGVTTDAGFGLDTAWTTVETWNAVRSSVRPELGSTASVQAIAVVGTVPADALEGVTVATVDEAIAALPAAEQQRTTIGGIVNTTFVVAAVVIGLFFALVTLEKRNQFAVLKAIGMRNRTLLGAVFAQALVASAAGFVAGLALARLVGLAIPPEVPTLFLTETALTVGVATLVTGGVGALLSFRRITTIDPATALGGAA